MINPVARLRRPARRWVALLGVTALAVTATVTGTLGSPDPAEAAPATGSSAAQRSAVVSGNARFEVLSPTLIRTEYAGDATFLDLATFNAIGRDSFAATPFTSKIVNGWLTIDTSAVTLRYKVGSGAFTTKNLTVKLQSGAQSVTARPWVPPTSTVCTVGTLCEAEDAQLDGIGVATDHTGYTGTGFAAGFLDTGNAMTIAAKVTEAGDYALNLRYANSLANDNETKARTLSVAVDGGTPHQVSLPTTGSWDDWQVVSAPAVTLSAGDHTVTVSRGEADSGNVNVDSVALLAAGASYPSTGPTVAKPCAFGQICPAENAGLSGGAALSKDGNGYSDAGFVGGLTSAGASVKIPVTEVPKTGSYNLQLRYLTHADGTAAPTRGQVSVKVGSTAATKVTLPVTSGSGAWRTVKVPVSLKAGKNSVTLSCSGDSGCNIDLDTVALVRKNSPLLAPHAALGGYRRGLDGVNGAATTTPGLLFADGWSLLDDTTSSTYDPATKKVTDRSSKPEGGYQDGYVFAYGHDYAQALADLARLTGPSKLLPRWTYGVWYSEYYNRTAADYQKTILPTFRSEGVPLDVLVTDTDYKSPSLWNGWQIDPDKFPDPKAFFDWAEKQGLHNSLNIHPSIQDTDPSFAAAQKTAKGKLALNDNGCFTVEPDSHCYVFDFSDPDQLKAYLGLHQKAERQGVDFWWMDWCCDESVSSRAGVTPDAWINQQYADDADKLVGRGFAFSRAFGSLQDGGYSGPTGVPTGPWADKRTTLHFTGDSVSSWETLRAQVGYTPGEASSTGLSAISHDIGGFIVGDGQTPGSEPDSQKLPDDLYARWVQFGTFQPIDRLHGNHSDRLPWQYGDDARKSAEKFLNLRENLVPYTYTLAKQAETTGTPVTRPLYLQYPEEQEAYAQSAGEYLYGPDVLVAPATQPGESTTTSVWFPPGDSWTDWFTGKTYQGGTKADITTDMSSMPVFVRSGGIVTTRTKNVTNDVQNPLKAANVTVAEGASGSTSLYEDDGTTTDPSASATTKISYTDHRLRIAPVKGTFAGQVRKRAWTVTFTNAEAPSTVIVNGGKVSADAFRWNRKTRTLRVTTPDRSVNQPLVVTYR